ncbi:CAS_1a_G0005880.mRNA.1.CDS.1 [Saccharomyces cerevisiae]|nr:CAS_1a_G0005880.mRNA.1.CDS.1 [Saccharomyces cerevisiae]CAI7170183.1 CAS_1a_G0005880.mRNA.1.CDS.1 [Saccharomyces cerevisiae]
MSNPKHGQYFSTRSQERYPNACSFLSIFKENPNSKDSVLDVKVHSLGQFNKTSIKSSKKYLNYNYGFSAYY